MALGPRDPGLSGSLGRRRDTTTARRRHHVHAHAPARGRGGRAHRGALPGRRGRALREDWVGRADGGGASGASAHGPRRRARGRLPRLARLVPPADHSRGGRAGGGPRVGRDGSGGAMPTTSDACSTSTTARSRRSSSSRRGPRFPPMATSQRVIELARAHGALSVFDEVITGFRRRARRRPRALRSRARPLVLRQGARQRNADIRGRPAAWDVMRAFERGVLLTHPRWRGAVPRCGQSRPRCDRGRLGARRHRAARWATARGHREPDRGARGRVPV